jgi:Fe-S-cluster containining protein
MDYFDFLNMHKNIRVIQKNKINFLEIKSKCDNLNDDGTCNIWDTRPEICRDPYTIGTKIIYFPECIYKQEENEEFDLWDD